MKKCFQCGTEYPDSAKFCSDCGLVDFEEITDKAGLSIGKNSSVSAHDMVGGNKETIHGKKEVISGNKEEINAETVNKTTNTFNVINQHTLDSSHNDPEMLNLKKRREAVEIQKLEEELELKKQREAREIQKLDAELEKLKRDNNAANQSIQEQRADTDKISRLEKALSDTTSTLRETQFQIKQVQEQAKRTKAETVAKPHIPIYATTPQPVASSRNKILFLVVVGVVVTVAIMFFIFKGGNDKNGDIVPVQQTTQVAEDVVVPNSAQQNTTRPSAKKTTTKQKQPKEQAEPLEYAVQPTQINTQQVQQSTPITKSPDDLYREGLSAYKKFNYSQAISCFKKAADAGNLGAQYYLGMMYLEGNSVEKSSSTAFSYIQKAANGGHKDASFQLGAMYEGGYGVDKNKSQAKIWYQKAANMGHSKAQLRVDNL